MQSGEAPQRSKELTMKKISKKKLTVGAQTLRQLSAEAIQPVAGGFVSWFPCSGASCLKICPM